MSDAFDPSTLADDAFVELCYEKFLGRPADPGGKAGYLTALNLGMTRLDLIQALVSGPEYHGVLTRLMARQAEVERQREVEAKRLQAEIQAGQQRAAPRIAALRRRFTEQPTAAETTFRPVGDHRDASGSLPWFFALNEAAWHFEDYARMARVAVLSARLNAPSLRPHLLYDGSPNAFTAWMEGHGVPVIPCRSRLYDDLARQAERRHNESILQVGAGAFMRVELPELFARGLVPAERVLYTDCDVLFMGDVAELAAVVPGDLPFAVAPEEDAADYVHVNTGVMMMNLPVLRARDGEFTAYCREHLETLLYRSWDQGAYQTFYAGQWARLDPTYNWKPYWEGNQDEAKVVHFHGPKPTQLGLVERQEHPDYIQRLARGAYFEWAAVWEEFDRWADGRP